MRCDKGFQRLYRLIIIYTCILTFGTILSSCNSQSKENEPAKVEKKEFSISDHIKIDDRPILIYVIDRWTCFRCGPLYCNSVKLLEQADTSTINKVLIIQYIREIERKQFLRDNLYINIDSNDFQIIYDNSIFFNIHEKYGKRQSLVLGFNDIENDPVLINHYHEEVYEEIVEFINSIDTQFNLVVPENMWY
jgi:hypothetical protein